MWLNPTIRALGRALGGVSNCAIATPLMVSGSEQMFTFVLFFRNDSLTSARCLWGPTNPQGSTVSVSQLKLRSESVMAHLYLGIAISGLYALVPIALFIVFI